ncbi:MAG: nucleotidyltransferase domain-containing protein [Nanoarchaeota archaeon]
MNQKNLIAYAASFVSFLLDTAKTKNNIKRIILFGSVARDDFTKESDIDLFIDAPEDIEPEVEKTYKLFMMSQTQKLWELKGLTHELSLKIGNLKEWDLRRSVISDGIVLYGRMRETPEEAEPYLLLQLSYKRLSPAQKIRMWRKLYGHQQKVGKKVYRSKGIVEKLKGTRIENGIVIPLHEEKEVLDFLKQHKVSYTLKELWSDAF